MRIESEAALEVDLRAELRTRIEGGTRSWCPWLNNREIGHAAPLHQGVQPVKIDVGRAVRKRLLERDNGPT